MASFKVLKLNTAFDVRGDSFTLDERTGFYKNDINENDLAGIYDLLFAKVYKIQQVKNEVGVVLSLGGHVSVNNVVGKVVIKSFQIVKNRLYINGYQISANNVTNWVEPAVIIPPVVLKQGETINNFLEIQRKIEETHRPLRLYKVRVEFTPPVESLESFVTNFIRTYNVNYNTCFVNTNEIQTAANKRRSLGDIYAICKYYYPECNLHDVIKLLYVTIPTNSVVGSLVCATINKRVWWNSPITRFDKLDMVDEYGVTPNEYRAKLAEAPVIIKPKVKAVEVQQNLNVNEDEAMFAVIKAKFPIGTKVKGMTGDYEFKIDSKQFHNGITSIIYTQANGKRRIIYNKTSQLTAKILR